MALNPIARKLRRLRRDCGVNLPDEQVVAYKTDTENRGLRGDEDALFVKIVNGIDETDTDVPIITGAASLQVEPTPTALGANALSRVVSPSTASVIAKAAPGRLYELSSTNTNAAVRWLQIQNAAIGATPTFSAIWSFAIPPGGSVKLSWRHGTFMSVGISIAVSTTHATLSSATDGEHHIVAEFA